MDLMVWKRATDLSQAMLLIKLDLSFLARVPKLASLCAHLSISVSKVR